MATLTVHDHQEGRRWRFLKLLVRELHSGASLDVFAEGGDTVLIYRYEGAITGWRLRPQDFDVGDEHFQSIVVASTLVRRILESLVALKPGAAADEAVQAGFSELEVRIGEALLGQHTGGSRGRWLA